MISRQSIKVNTEEVQGELSYLHRPETSKLPLVCLHGLQTNSSLFENLFPNHEIYAFDLFGFGNSEKPENFSYDVKAQTEVVLAALRELNINQYILVGHSLGGMIGTLMLEQCLGKMLAFINIEGNLLTEDCGASMKSKDLSLQEFATKVFLEIKTMLSSLDSPSAPLRRKAVNQVPDYAFLRTSQSIVQWSEGGELLEIFQNAKIPSLLVIGENSHYHSRPVGEMVKIEIIDNASHFLPIEKPSELNDAFIYFINELGL